LGFGLLSVAPSNAATARTTTVGAVTTTTIVAGVSSTLCQVDLSGALDVSESDTIQISAVTGTVGGVVTWTSIGTAENAANTTTVGGAAENLVFTGGTDSGTDDQAVVGSIDLPGVYTFDWAGTGECTVRVLPSTSGAATLTASQAHPVGISTRNNAITVSRNTGGANTDGVVLGQFTSTADSTDAPLTTVFGKVGSTTDLAAVSVGGSAATPVVTVARTNLTAGSYTVRFWVDSNTSQTFDSGEVSTTATFTVAGAADSISLAVTGATRANETGHKQVTVTATVADEDGNASTVTNLYISESSSAGADSANSYFDFADDTALARIGTTNQWTITFNVDTGTGGDDYDTAYFTVADNTDLTASGIISATSSVKIVNFANLEDSDAAMTATDSTGIGSYAATGVRQELYATDDADDTLTVDPAITSITYTGAAEDDAGEFIYWSAVPTAGTTTCLTSSSGYVEVLGDQSFTVTIAATCTDGEGYTITFTGSDNAALTITYDDPSPTWTTTPGASWKAVNGSKKHSYSSLD